MQEQFIVCLQIIMNVILAAITVTSMLNVLTHQDHSVVSAVRGSPEVECLENAKVLSEHSNWQMDHCWVYRGQ